MSLSVCIIGRDEESVVERCLKSAKLVADQIVFVDTGSTDATREIASRYADVLADFKWIDDFSEARNHSIMHATKDWILWMDCDDEMTEEAAVTINKIKHDAADCAFAFLIKNVDAKAMEAVEHEEFMQMRMFPRRDDLRFEHRIHEQIAQSIYNKGLRIFEFSKVPILHHGYNHELKVREKLSRNRRLTMLAWGASRDAEFIEWEQGSYMMLYTPNILSSWKLGQLIGMRDVAPIEIADISTAKSFEKLKKIGVELGRESIQQERHRKLSGATDAQLEAEIADTNRRIDSLLSSIAGMAA